MSEQEELKIDVVKQCGSYFLFKFKCPFCRADNFTGDPKECEDCDQSFEDYMINIENLRYEMVSGIKRKTFFTKKLKERMQRNQCNKCAYCFVPFTFSNPYQVEHVKPLSCGGGNNEENLVLSCKPCNSTASNFYFTDFYAKQAYILDKKLKRTKRYA